jgi:hypothetical protein
MPLPQIFGECGRGLSVLDPQRVIREPRRLCRRRMLLQRAIWKSMDHLFLRVRRSRTCMQRIGEYYRV